MTQNPNCIGCELQCGLSAARDTLNNARTEAVLPADEAQLNAEVAAYGYDQAGMQEDETRSIILNEGPRYVRAVNKALGNLARDEEVCPGQRRGVTLPVIGFVATGFGKSVRCDSPYAPIGHALLKNIEEKFGQSE